MIQSTALGTRNGRPSRTFGPRRALAPPDGSLYQSGVRRNVRQALPKPKRVHRAYRSNVKPY